MIVGLLCFLSFFSINQGLSSSFLYSVTLQSNVTHGQGLVSYDDAVNYDIDSSEARFDVKELFIKNSASDLYIAVRVEHQDGNNEVGLALSFDTNHDLLWTEDIKIVYFNPSQERQDGFFFGSSAISYQPESQRNFNGLASSFVYGPTGTTQRLYEFKIPFQTANPTQDLSVYDPDGFLISIDITLIFNSTDYVSWNSGNQSNLMSSATAYQSLMLAGPGRYLIPNFEPVVITTTPPQTGATLTVTGAGTTEAVGAAGTSGFEILPVTIAVVLLGITIAYRRRSR